VIMENEKYDAFEKQMHDAYPEMFSQPYGGFAIGEGWFQVIASLCANINHHIDWANKNRETALEYNALLQKAIDGDRGPMLEYFGERMNPEARVDEAIEQGLRKVRDAVEPVVVRQIKEKFGGLRFYYDGGDEYVSGLVSMAEAWAGHTCEKCGNKGEQRSGGWIRTLCDVHEVEAQEAMKKREY
jgi:hypothetical protein